MNKTAAIVFFGIVLIGLIVSLLTLSPFRGSKDSPGAVSAPSGPEVTQPPGRAGSAPATGSVSVEAPSQPGATPGKSQGSKAGVDPVAASSPEKRAPAGEPASGPAKGQKDDAAVETQPEGAIPSFANPQEAASRLAEKVGSGDWEGLLALAPEGASAEPVRRQLESFLGGAGWKLSAERPVTELSKSVGASRWAINLESVADPTVTEQIYADIIPIEGGGGVRIGKIALPLDFAGGKPSTTGRRPAGEATPGEAAPGSMKAKAGPGVPSPDSPPSGEPGGDGPDALTVAHAFSKAVSGRDFTRARELADETSVTDERLAALLYAVEEGSFSLRQERPLVVTLDREDVAWVLARVEGGGQTSEFALELARAGRSWKINGLTFSKVIASLANRAGAGEVAYAPIVEDPAGGDSLVIYFEFDEAGLTPRATRQLGVVADILGVSPDRRLRINGHADALGTDSYNKRLSDDRAASVRKALISMGVAPNQVITEAYGESKPRQPNFKSDGSDNPGGRSQNRRAEVYLDF